MEFNIGQHHIKGKIKFTRRKALKIQKSKLQVTDQLSSLSLSQGKFMTNPEPVNLEKEKIENLKQVIVKQEEAIFNLSNQIREILTNYGQLNIEMDQLKEFLVKKIILRENKSDFRLKFHHLKMLKVKMEIEDNQSQLSHVLAPQQDQQECNKDQGTIKRIEDIEKQLGKNTKRTTSGKKY